MNTDTSNDHILSSDNIHYLHHDFFEPSHKDTAVKATLLIVHGMAEHSGRYADFAQFLADNEQRQQRGLPLRELDQRLLAAQAEGLPDCAGVALGVDRLLALQIGVSTLAETLSFDWHRA